jgi:hypothetical protein
LKSRLTERKYDNLKGTDRLGNLLSKKSSIAYAADTARESEIENVLKEATRFVEWAEHTGRKMRIEGW